MIEKELMYLRDLLLKPYKETCNRLRLLIFTESVIPTVTEKR